MFANSENYGIMVWYRVDDRQQPRCDGRAKCSTIELICRKGRIWSGHVQGPNLVACGAHSDGDATVRAASESAHARGKPALLFVCPFNLFFWLAIDSTVLGMRLPERTGKIRKKTE